MKITKKERGFTLIELMIVVAIIGILAAIAIPRFADLIRKSNEGATKGSLGAVRSAVTIYYGEMEGVYISSGSGTTGAIEMGTISGPFQTKYIDQIPSTRLGLPGAANHAGSKVVNDFTTTALTEGTAGQAGQWLYQSSNGLFVVGCSHTDTKSTSISTW